MYVGLPSYAKVFHVDRTHVCRLIEYVQINVTFVLAWVMFNALSRP